MADIATIENRIDKALAGNIEVSFQSGGIAFRNMSDVMEFSKIMAVAEQAVPKHCRGNPGLCLSITLDAIGFDMSPFAVANKSYVVNDRVSYESQLIHAVIERRAPIVGRLRHKFNGEGAGRTCTVWATAEGETEPLEYTSPRIGDIKPKNSPLWTTKPDLQLYYNTTRDWARVYFPDVILGVYSKDELMDSVQMVDERPQIPMPQPMKVTTVPVNETVVDAPPTDSAKDAATPKTPKTKSRTKKPEPEREPGEEAAEPHWDEPPVGDGNGTMFAETAQAN